MENKIKNSINDKSKELKIPVSLKHKPVIVCKDYSHLDGRYATLQKDSDAKGLSLGLAQWNDRGEVDISAKVWRYTGEKWSRQSEELPLHRVLDLAILIAEAKKYFANAYRFEKLYDDKNTVIDRVALQGKPLTIEVCTDNDKIDGDIQLFRNVLVRDDEIISERLKRLSEILKELGY